MSAPKPNLGIHPRSVIPGIENQDKPSLLPEPGIWCRPDWIRLVGPEANSGWLYGLLRERFGEPTGTSNGAQYFTQGILWHPGIMLSQGHKSSIVMVDFQGARLAVEDPNAILQLVEQIYCRGFHATRLDLAVDWVGQDVDLYNHALASCQASELCKLRSFRLGSEYTREQEAKGLLLYLGKRSSPVYIRIYDKGLETGSAPAGVWERFEVELKEDRATTVMMAFLDAGDQWVDELWARMIGAVDFRVNNGRTELHRRPRVAWWGSLIGRATPKPTKPMPKESSFDHWCDWFRTAAGKRLLQLANTLGLSPNDFFEYLIANLEPATTLVPAVVDAGRSRQS